MRPSAGSVNSPADVIDWYWTRAELVQIAKRLGVPRSGSKQHLIDVIVAALAGEVLLTSALTSAAKGPRVRLQPPFSLTMVIPAGQPFTRALRDWAESQVGGPVRVSSAVRELLRNPLSADGRPATLGELIAVLASPQPPSESIGSQFERNRFMRLLSQRTPHLSRHQREQEWMAFRQLPSTQRVQALRDVP